MRSAARLSLHLRGTTAVFAAASVVAAGSLAVGTTEVPVPTNLASSADAVPYMVLAPILVALAMILRRPYGSEWLERGVPQPARLRNVDRALLIAAGLLITVVPVMAGVSAGLVTVCWRNIGLLSILGALATQWMSRAAAAFLALLLALVTLSFGSSASGAPYPWALLLLGPEDALSWLVLAVLVIADVQLRRSHYALLAPGTWRSR